MAATCRCAVLTFALLPGATYKCALRLSGYALQASSGATLIQSLIRVKRAKNFNGCSRGTMREALPLALSGIFGQGMDDQGR